MIMTLSKKNRPGPSLQTLRKLGVPAMDHRPASEADNSLSTMFERIMFGAGVNFVVQVFDCESVSGVTESDSGTFDIVAAAAAGKRVGTNCMKLVNTAATDGSQYVRLANINESEALPAIGGVKQADWNDTAFIGFWNSTANSGDYNVAGDMKIAIEYDGGKVSTKQNVPATVSTVHQWAEFAFSAFYIADTTTAIPLDKIEAIRFYSTNADVADYVQYDDIQRYLISYNGAPLYGSSFPVKNGTTLSNKSTAKWTVDGLILATDPAHPQNLGPVELFAASALGDGKRNKWGMFKGGHIGIVRAGTGTTAGDLLEWESDRHYNDVTTTATAEGMCIALETAGAAEDDIFVLFLHGSAVG
jgi:hypothetical protein